MVLVVPVDKFFSFLTFRFVLMFYVCGVHYIVWNKVLVLVLGVVQLYNGQSKRGGVE